MADQPARDGAERRLALPVDIGADTAGDSACWLAAVCPTCGAFNEAPAGPCWNCGKAPEPDRPGLPRT